MIGNRNGQLESSISVASFTHLGYGKDLKSEPTYYMTKGLADSGLLRQLYVLDVADAHGIPRSCITVPVPGGKLIPRGFYLAEHVFPQLVDARSAIIGLFDRMTSRLIGDEAVLHTFPHLTRSLTNAQKNGVTTVVYASSCHPYHTAELLLEERERLGVSSTVSPDTTLIEGYELADYIFYLSEYSKETFLENGFDGDRLIKVGPLGTNLDVPQSTENNDGEYNVLSVANMTELKGINYLLDAWEAIDIEDATLILCGTMNAEVESAIGDRVASMDDVRYEGYVDDPAENYASADAFVHPSLSESFGKVIAEAMAAKLPVIITEHGPREFVDDAGFVVPIRDPDSLKEKIEWLYHNPDSAKTMGEHGRELVEDNTWDDFSSRIEQAHLRILHGENS